jgi:ABC-type multidrug transport system permease subunit
MRVRVLSAITWTVLREHLRTPEAVFWTYGFPLLMALVLGFAFGEGRQEPVRIAVSSAPPAALRSALLEAGGGRIAVEELDPAAAHRALTLGIVDLVVSGTPDRPVFDLDPRRSGSELARLHAERALRRSAGTLPPLVEEIREVDEPGDRYIDFLIAGLIGMNLLGAGMYGIGYNVVLMRSNKLLRRLSVTPMRRSEFLAAFLLSRTLLALPPPLVVLAFGMLVFGVPVHGSWPALLGFTLLGALAFAGIGILVASRARTTESVSGLINLVTMPMWLLGGIFFSNERFPAVLQPLVQAMPMTHFTDGMRGIMLGSFEPWQVLVSSLVLALVTLASFAAAIRLFRWS